MRDKISQERVNKLHPAVRDEVAAIITKVENGWPAGYAVRIVQGLRTIEEQNALYAQGRTKPGKIVTNAKGGKSYHNHGLAFDICILINGAVSWKVDEYWMMIVRAFKAAGWVWGGDFKSIKDNPHFEKSFGFKVAQLMAMYKPGEYVKIPAVG